MIRFAQGPSSKLMTQEEALEKLTSHPDFPKGAEVAVINTGGRWLAAISESDWKTADNPFGGPPDEEKGDSGEPDGPPAPDKGSVDTDGDGDTGGDSDGDGDGPPKGDEHKEHGEGDKGGDKAVLHELLGIVTQMAQALGIAPPGGPEEGMVPGAEGPEGGDMAPPPPGPPGPPHGHGGPPPGGADQTVQHQRALKPGEAPPGTTPVGAPAFASTSVPDDHPWKDQIGKTATFTVKHVIPEDYSLAKVNSELTRVAYGTGFKVKQIGEAQDEHGRRIAKALISAY
jgi:hypothetical protein